MPDCCDDMTPLVSVIMPTYNQEKFIAQAIDGVLAQNANFPIELLIGEDESSDRTREICLDFAARFPERISIILGKRKDVIYIRGQATGRANMLRLLDAANGKYVAFCEGDDYWSDDTKLQTQVDFLDANPDYAISFHDALVIGDRKPANVSYYSDFGWCKMDRDRANYAIEDLLEGPLMPTASVVIRNDFSRNFPTWFNRVMSADMALFAICLKGRKIRRHHEVMSVYRKHSGGVTANHRSDDIHLNRIFMYKKINDYLGKQYDRQISAKILEHRNLLQSPFSKVRALWG